MPSFDITDIVQDLWPNCPVPLLQGVIDTSDDVFAKCQLNTRNRILHFMATISAESNGGTIMHESLYYTTARRLRQVWPARFRSKSDAELETLLRNPDALANAVYEGRMGNVQPGDGALFAGAGFDQITGRAMFEKMKEFVGIDVIANPGALTAPDTALLCAAADWVCICGCIPYADEGNFLAVEGCVNVGNPNVSSSQVVGWADRQAWFHRWDERLPQ
jgi:putative chitinase